MEERRIYSINTADYLANIKGHEYKIGKDEDKEDLYYFVFDVDLTEEIEEFDNNKLLQDFIRGYKDIRKRLNAFKNEERRKLHR